MINSPLTNVLTKGLWIVVIVFYLEAPSLAQQLPDYYPGYYFSFELADSTEYEPLYPDRSTRNRLTSKQGNAYKRARIIEEYIMDSREIDFLERLKAVSSGNDEGGRIWKIKLADGSDKYLKIPKHSGALDYNLEQYYEKPQLLLFRVQYSEGSNYLIVDRKTGVEYTVMGPPSFSPGGRYFISFNGDIEARYSPNGLELYEMVKSQPRLRLSYEMEVAPSRVKWIDESAFYLETYYFDLTESSINRKFEHYRVSFVQTGK